MGEQVLRVYESTWQLEFVAVVQLRILSVCIEIVQITRANCFKARCSSKRTQKIGARFVLVSSSYVTQRGCD